MDEINHQVVEIVGVEENHHSEDSKHEGSVLSPDVQMMLLTWVTFILLLVVLKKFAWKPILKALDDREAMIRQSVEEAERIKQELAQINQKRERIIEEAENKAKEIIDQARKASVEVGIKIKHDAKEEANILLKNAEREIKDKKEKLSADLRLESANAAVSLASRLVEENLDTEKNRRLIDQLIKKI